MLRKLLLPACMIPAMALAAVSAPAPISLRAQDGGAFLQAGGRSIGSGAGWLQVRDWADADGKFVPVPVAAEGGTFGGTVCGLAFTGEVKPFGSATEIHCIVAAKPPRDRAVTVRVALPVDAVGWKWWDNLNTTRQIEAGQHYDRLTDLDGRRVSTYPFCAISGPQVGLSLAVPLAEPRVFRLAYDAGGHALEADFDLGLSPDTLQFPAKADFRLLLYSHDPRAGFRDALQRYYGLFPQYTERRVPHGGIWLLGFAPEKMASPWDFGFAYDEGAQFRAGYDCAHDILPFVYTEPWGKYEHFGNRPTPDHKPRYDEGAPLLSPPELKRVVLDDLNLPEGRMDSHFGFPRREVAHSIANSAIEDAKGNWIWRHWTDEWSPGDWLSNVTLNPSPFLPEPNRASLTWRAELDTGFAAAKQSGGELAGVYLDSVGGFMGFHNENFRREQWRYARSPLVPSLATKGPTQLHAFPCYEFAVQVYDRMRAQGKYTIGNTSPPYWAFFFPQLDIIGAGEVSSCGLASDDYYGNLRIYGYRKPISWMDYGFVNPKTPWEQKERGLQRCLFYAVHPGTGGFDTPAAYEPSRALFRTYEPLITWLDEAGWQPVTKVSTPDSKLLLERYGPGRGKYEDVAFIAVMNSDKQPVEAQLQAAREALPGKGPWSAWRLLGDEPVKLASPVPGDVMLPVSLKAEGVEVIAVGAQQAIARLWLGQAADWLRRIAEEARWLGGHGTGSLGNGDFEQGLAPWGADTPPSAHGAEVEVSDRQPISGKRSLMAQSHADDAYQAVNQGVMLPGGREYSLRFKLRWNRPAGDKGTVSARFGVKGPDGNWVEKQYIYFNDLVPSDGRIDTYVRPFTVPVDHSAGFIQFMFQGNWGTAWIDDVSITSATGETPREALGLIASQASAGAAALGKGMMTTDLRQLCGLTTPQEALYRRLTTMAGNLGDAHQRRCILLPAQGFAEAIGRAAEVLTSATLHGPDDALFLDAAVDTSQRIAFTLRAGDRALGGLRVVGEEPAAVASRPELSPGEAMEAGADVKLPEAVPTGWQDLMVHAAFTCDGVNVWLPRRFTLRARPAFEVSATGPLSSVGDGLPLSLRSWVANEGTARLDATGVVGEQGLTFEPVNITLQPSVAQEVHLPLTAETQVQLDAAAAMQDNACKLSWRASIRGGDTTDGTVAVPVVRGARCPTIDAPTLDAAPDAPAWANAARLEGFSAATDGKPAARQTTVHLGHDDRNLHILFECHAQPEPKSQPRARDGAVWEDDAVEVFIAPPGAEGYYHFAANSAGVQYDARCFAGNDAGWNARWEARAGRIADGWTMAIAIPLEAVGAKPSGLWRMNFCREEADTKVATSWSWLFGSFHTPERFGQVRF